MLQIQWYDWDPQTKTRRYLRAVYFAGQWCFAYRMARREPWTPGLAPTRAMWEHVLDSLKRRYRRREGVDDEHIEQVERILKEAPRPENLPGVCLPP
ncbi:MAG: hypothetical protein NZO58_05605 [Gemmataceae bacterium]|nr:hypothetical protein [Gemmataceae bacterium]